MSLVATFEGDVQGSDLGATLIHEHIFVRNPELEVNLPDGEWDPGGAVDVAVDGLTRIHAMGIRTVVDLTVPGLGRDVRLVGEVARRVPVHLIAATGWYTSNVLPLYFRFHGPGRTIDRVDPLIDLFVSDIREGIGGTGVRAAMLKVMADEEGFTADVQRVMAAAVVAHQETGVAITTHSHAGLRNGLDQQAFLTERGVPSDRIVIGHAGDSDDLDYLCALMDNGSTVGFDRFGMAHVRSDELRLRTLLALLELGYADRIVLSHDAAFYSHVTPPSWRAVHAPEWRMDTIPGTIIPLLAASGLAQGELDQLMIDNPRRLLEGSA